jgi:glycosyltransferase involved in cell wall biosynthesis
MSMGHTTPVEKLTPAAVAEVAYLCARFPKLSEQFVVREVEELERQGVKVQVLTLLTGVEGAAPAGCAVTPPPGLRRIITGHLMTLCRRPAGWAGALGAVLAEGFRQPRELPEALYVFALAGGWAPALSANAAVGHLHAHFAGAPTTAAWLLARMTGLPFGFTAHANDIFVRPFALPAKMRAARYVVTVSAYNRRHLESIAPDCSDKLHVLATGLPEEEFHSPAATPDPHLILAVGRLVPKKGFGALVRALGHLHQRGVPFRCVVVGDGPERARLEQLAAERQLGGQLTFLGGQPPARVRDLLGRARLFVLPCVVAPDGDRDGLPHSIMEAMAAGVPVVTTRTVGIPELVRDGEAGLLVEPDDDRALATAIGRVLGDDALARRLAEGGRRAVRAHCHLPTIVGRLRALFGAAARMALLSTCLAAGAAVAQPAAGELFPDPDLKTPGRVLRPYSNFDKSDPVVGWQARIDTAGKATTTAADRQPAARVGVRTVPISIGAGDYTAVMTVAGDDVMRAGFYAILVDAADNMLAQQELVGPAGDFRRDFAMSVTVQPEHARQNARLILYAFHDGAGTMTVERISVRPAEGGVRSVAPRRQLRPIFHQLTLPGRLYEPPFPLAPEGLLSGESRWALAPAGGAANIDCYTIEDREVALSWDMGVVQSAPFWLRPAAEGGQVCRLAGPESDATAAPLPPLPADRGLYLFFYGAYRYGGKPRDLERDRADLRRLREAGVTGVAFWDNYGLDYHKFLEGKPMDGAYLVAMAGLYRELGFTSPMLFTFFGGLDRGRVGWKSGSAEEMRLYLEAVKPWLDQARAALGPVELWVCPMDEPDDAERQPLAIKLAALWPEVTDTPLFVTTNWQTARRLGTSARLLLGAGSLPSFEAARSLGVVGGYCSLDANMPPLRYRYLAGVYTWAAGNRIQAYWHHESIAGKLDSDLDGHMPDFLARDPKSGAPTIPFTQVQEGLMDLRLLLALESAAAGDSPAALAARSFLEKIRLQVPPTDRLASPWDEVGHYEQFTAEARRLWRQLPLPAAPAATPTENTHMEKPE